MCHVPFLFLWSSLADSQWCHEEINCFCWKQGFIIIQKGEKKKKQSGDQTRVFVFFMSYFLAQTEWNCTHNLPLHFLLVSVAQASLSSPCSYLLQTTLQPFVIHSRFPFLPHDHLSFLTIWISACSSYAAEISIFIGHVVLYQDSILCLHITDLQTGWENVLISWFKKISLFMVTLNDFRRWILQQWIRICLNKFYLPLCIFC